MFQCSLVNVERMPEPRKGFGVLHCKNRALSRVGNPTEDAVLETHSVLPLIASFHRVTIDYGNVGTLRTYNQEAGVWWQSLPATFTCKKLRYQAVQLLSQHKAGLPVKDPKIETFPSDGSSVIFPL